MLQRRRAADGDPSAAATAVPVGRREQNKAETRAVILAAARETFAELGLGQATIRDIVRRTDLGVGTFYNYFPDKESVFRRLFEEAAVAVRARVRAARARATTLEELVRGGFLAWFEAVAEDPAMLEVMRRNTGAMRALLAEPAATAGLDELLDDIRAATERGVIGPVDVDYLAAATWGIAIELAVRMVERAPIDPEATAAFATALVVQGIGALPPPGAQKRRARGSGRKPSHDAGGHRSLAHRRRTRRP